ncbi:MAG: hypothetical protein HQL25_08795 [Candidatus Omnitrophica bacterium]|nr:hypothetical protein [Candidatus Omnitrophota bacterium]
MKRKRQHVSDEMFSVSKRIGTAVKDFDLMKEGDRILVVVDGTAASWCCADLLVFRRSFAPIQYDVEIVIPQDILSPEFCSYIRDYSLKFNVTCHWEEKYIFTSESRVLLAKKFNCNKVAVFDDLDDMIERFMKIMLLKGSILDQRPYLEISYNIFAIYPLAYVDRDQINLMAQVEYPNHADKFISKSDDFETLAVRDMINALKKQHVGVRKNIFNCAFNINTEYLI